MTSGAGFGVPGLGCCVWGAGFGVPSLGCRVSGAGFRVPGLERRVCSGDLQVLCLDQGSSGWAAGQYLLHRHQLALRVFGDPFHRIWNDVRGAARQSRAAAWRTMLEMTLVFNLNTGPFGSGAWASTKRDMQQRFLEREGPSSPAFLQYASAMAKDRGEADPVTDADYQRLWAALRSLETFAKQGPLVKLMRWFSFFESARFYRPELSAIKMLLEYGQGLGAPGSPVLPLVPAAPGSPVALEVGEQGAGQEPQSAADAAAELRDLKRRSGLMKLAPTLINEKNIWNLAPPLRLPP